MKAAVLLLIFNRPQLLERVVSALREFAPDKLYIASDGPRADCPDDYAKVAKSRSIVSSIDWPCEVRTLYRDRNLGCRVAVSGAIDWFFEQEDAGVILEDDCIPDPSFFSFCEELLLRYKDDQRVMSIGGQDFFDGAYSSRASYLFSKYNHTTGWATWRRAWQLYDRDMALWDNIKDSDWLAELACGNRLFESHWANLFRLAYEDQKFSSWAYRWTFSCWAQRGLSIVPTQNLVINVGLGADATHTTSDDGPLFRLPLRSMRFPLRHPDVFARVGAAEHWVDRNVYGITVPSYIKRQIRRLPFGETFASVYRRIKR